MTLKSLLGPAAAGLLLTSASAVAGEIDVQLSTTLPTAHAVKIEAIPVETGPSAALSLGKPAEVKTSGAEKVEGVFEPYDGSLSGWFSYAMKVVFFDDDGGPIALKDDDTPYDTTPIVDIFIDGDCDDCGDYDFSAPAPAGGAPSSIKGNLALLNSVGDTRWRVTALGNDDARPAASAQITLSDSENPEAPAVLTRTFMVELDNITRTFTDDLVFIEGEPANKQYQVFATWLDQKGAQLGVTEVFTVTAEVQKKRKDGTYVYRPWRFQSALGEVVGETWDVEGVTDTFVDATALLMSVEPTDGGPKPTANPIRMPVADYVGRGQARDAKVAGELKVGQTYVYQGEALDGTGRVLLKGTWSLTVVDDPEQGLIASTGLNGCKGVDGPCLTDLTIRYADTLDEANPSQVFVTAKHLVTAAPAATVSLTLIKEKSTGPAVSQEGQPAGTVKLAVDTRRARFDGSMHLIYAPGTSDETFTYATTVSFLNAEGKPLGESERAEWILEPKGDGAQWVLVSDASSVEMK